MLSVFNRKIIINNEGRRKLLEVMDMFMTYVVVTVLWVYT